jgi:predicted PurR-regulated permease PerM
LGLVQPVIGRTGSLLGTIASGTAITLGWVFFILILSYFILADAGQLPHNVVNMEIPGYDSDIRRIFKELSRIWNAFLRGQIIMFTFSVLIYTFLFTVLGVRYVLALALVSGLARFVPYIGQWVNWAVLILVLVFQKSNYFGLGTWQYVILVAAIVFVVDQVLDNIVSPRILGRSIGVHPAGVLIAALIGFSLLGIVGVILAAPGLASLTMLGGYIGRKMLDLDPWPKSEPDQPAIQYPWMKWGKQVWTWMKDIRDWFIRKYRSGN